jgi:fermentation-respiration switch protein FrsA (DUF1100 family)
MTKFTESVVEDAALAWQEVLGYTVSTGRTSPRANPARHDVAWHDLGDAGLPDRILWHKAVAAKYPSYDITRVGIYGGSAGGQNSLGALLFHPDFYKVAVSYAGCHDNRMDKIWWNEQWMGWPIGPQYSASSNVDNAYRLQGKVLLVVGELDTNVDPSSTMQVVNALIKANKTFDLLVVPGEDHGAGRRGITAAYGSTSGGLSQGGDGPPLTSCSRLARFHSASILESVASWLLSPSSASRTRSIASSRSGLWSIDAVSTARSSFAWSRPSPATFLILPPRWQRPTPFGPSFACRV